MDLSIIVPAHNEAATIGGPLFKSSVDWLAGQYPSSELIVVDDGSTDDTAEKASLIADRVIRQTHSGKGAALCRGINEATGDIIVWADADWSVPATEVPGLIAKVREGVDYVMGSRGWDRPDSPLFRWLGSCLYTIACRITFDWELSDTQCGMKAGKRGALQEVIRGLRFFGAEVPQDVPSTDALFDVECLLVAREMGLRIRVQKVEWKHYQNRSSTNYRPLLQRISRDFRKVRRAYNGGIYEQPSNTDRLSPG